MTEPLPPPLVGERFDTGFGVGQELGRGLLVGLHWRLHSIVVHLNERFSALSLVKPEVLNMSTEYLDQSRES